MTRVDVGPIPLDHPRAAVRARRRPGGAGRAARQDDGHAAGARALRRRLAGAGIAAVAAAALTLAGWRAVDGRAMLLGTAFSTMTALLAVHALSTPGVLIGPNGVIAFAGRPRHPRRHRPARPDRAAGAAPHAQRQAAARAPDLARRARGRARRRRARVPDARPQGPDRRLRRRLRAARLRPQLLRRCSPTARPAPSGSPAARPTCWSPSAASGSASRWSRSS